MELLDQGFIFRSDQAADERRTCMFMALCTTSSGAILDAFRRGSSKDSADGNATIAQSRDKGATWDVIFDGFQSELDSRKGEIRAAAVVELKPGELTAFLNWNHRPKADSKLYDEKSDSLLASHLLLAHSLDEGRSWSDYRVLDTGEHTGCALTGGILRGLPDGSAMLTFESYGPRGGSGPVVHAACGFITSDGESLSPLIIVAEDPTHERYYWDQRLAFSPHHGRPVGLFWSYARASERDLPIHIAWGAPDARSWEPPRSTGIRGQIATPIPLPDGRLLAFYVHRHPPGSMRLVMSEDAGRTWQIEDELVVYESKGAREHGTAGESDFAQLWEDMSTWTFGYPAAVVLDDGTLLLAHYAGESADRLSARWARVQV